MIKILFKQRSKHPPISACYSYAFGGLLCLLMACQFVICNNPSLAASGATNNALSASVDNKSNDSSSANNLNNISNKQATPVVGYRVKTGEIHQQLVTSGDVLPTLGIDLFPKIVGQIVKLDVSEGTIVEEGQIVAEIDHRIQDTQLEQAQAALTVAQAAVDMQQVMVQTAQSALNAAKAQADAIKAQVTNLTTNRNRLEKLHKEGAIPKQQLDDVIAQHDAAQAQLRAANANINQATDAILTNKMNLKMKEAQLIQAKANLHAVQVQREDAFIKAPFKGIVTRRYVDPGAMATPNQPILRLEKMNPIKIVGTLVEKDLLLLTPGKTEARIKTDSVNQEFKGVVGKIYPAIDPKTRTGQFEIVIDNPDLLLRSGMFAHIKLYLNSASGTVVIPRDALLSHNGNKAAIRVNASGIAEKVPVRTGIVQDEKIEILEGLKPGDIIVVQGAEFVRAGTPVKVFLQEDQQ